MTAVFISNVKFSFCLNSPGIGCSGTADASPESVFAVTKTEWIATLCLQHQRRSFFASESVATHQSCLPTLVYLFELLPICFS